MKRVTGLGGIFFKARDPRALGDWYRRHLGLDVNAWGGAVLRWADDSPGGSTAWSLVGPDSDQFAPSPAPFMVNFRVADLHGLLAALRQEGCQVLEKVDESDYGKFGWVLDPEGNKVELWEPPPGR